MKKLLFSVTTLLLCALTALWLLTGCIAEPAPSPSSSAPPSEPEPVSSEPEPVSSEPEPEPESVPEPESEPADGLEPVTEATRAQLTGSWFWFVDGEPTSGAETYQLRFDEPEQGRLMFSFGLYESGAGVFYSGDYTIGEGGEVSATLEYSDFEVVDPMPPVSISFTMLADPAEPDKLTVTLNSYDTEDLDFPPNFDQLVGQALVYEKLF